MKILVIDNFDSFTYNLFQFLGELGAELQVFRNDAISLPEIRERSPDGIVISPGPGIPDNSGITLSVIKEFEGIFPILGVCLGHQAIGQAFGGIKKSKFLNKILQLRNKKHFSTYLVTTFAALASLSVVLIVVALYGYFDKRVEAEFRKKILNLGALL